MLCNAQALDLEQEKCDALVREAQIVRVSNLMEGLFSGAAITAEGTRKMRDTADALDVSLTSDLNVLRGRLDKMFVVEVEDLIESGAPELLHTCTLYFILDRERRAGVAVAVGRVGGGGGRGCRHSRSRGTEEGG